MTRAAIAQVDLFHFAGHGIGGDAEGGGELRLARAGRLSAAEILVLDKVPRFVVLSGCETAIADRGAAVEGLGLAQAFLLRGAEAVVASVDPVPEADAAALFSDFYPASSGRAFDLAALLARGQRRELARGNTAILRFRVFVR